MKKKYTFIFYLFLLLSLITEATFSQEPAPQLLAPENGARYQRTSGLKLQWEVLQGDIYYQVQYALDSLFTPQSIVSTFSISGTSLTIASLKNDTRYYWRVKASFAEGTWSEKWYFETTSLPTAPDLIAPLDSAHNIYLPVTFSWSLDSVNSYYLVQIAENSTFDQGLINVGSEDTVFSYDNLEYNQQYYWRVKGYNVDEVESEWSEILTFKTSLAVPELILPVNKFNADTSVVLDWRNVPGAEIYNVQIAEDSLFETLLDEFALDITEIKIDSLNYRSLYYWRVMAYNSQGDSSAWSPTVFFTTRLGNPAALLPVDNTRNLDTLVQFQWTNVEEADSYYVAISLDSLFEETAAEGTTDSTSLTIDTLNYNTRYYWKVFAFTFDGDSSRPVYRTFKTRLAIPELMHPAEDSVNIPADPEFTWEEVDGAESYLIDYSNDSTFERTTPVIVDEPFYLAEDLVFDSTYYWRVLAYNAETDSSVWSETRKFKTRPAVMVLPANLNTSKNLAGAYSDTLAVVKVSNEGTHSINYKSIYISKDTIFSVTRNNFIVLPDSNEEFAVKIDLLKIEYGLTQDTLFLIRDNSPFPDDTLARPYSIFIRKAAASFSDSTFSYDSTNAQTTRRFTGTIDNTEGNYPLVIKDIIIEGSDTSSFIVEDYPERLEPGQSGTFIMDFEPLHPGMHNAAIIFNTNSFPDTNITFPLIGIGRGGVLSAKTLTRMESLEDSTFETFTENDKPVTFINTGNGPLDVKVTFPQEYFKIKNDLQHSFRVKKMDSLKVEIKYLTPNFDEDNLDTLVIKHSGFGDDSIRIPLTGTFDSLASAKRIQENLRVNYETFAEKSKILPEDTRIIFTLNPNLFDGNPDVDFRLNYFTGGPEERKNLVNSGDFNFIIPQTDVDERGLLINGEVTIKDKKKNEIADSMAMFKYIDIQVILSDYKTQSISVPRSTPAETEEAADAKWVMFGFPFEEVPVDSAFKYFGGREKMEDGEWLIYQYDLSAPDSFSVFDDYSFTPSKAYFVAQSLLDTFKISHKYANHIRTRKLTDTLINLPATNWKTLSSPFLFDVQIDSSATLWRYDTNNKTYKMTNIMKPGEGYFVDPFTKEIKMKTFGKYDPRFFPKILSDIGWFVKLNVNNDKENDELFFSILNKLKFGKQNINEVRKEYSPPPQFQKGLRAVINGTDEQSVVSVKENQEGGIWDVQIINELKDDKIIITPGIEGNIPADYKVVLFDNFKKQVIDPNDEIVLQKSIPFKVKVIIGTEDFINKTLAELGEGLPKEFSISQNYPNPFNPTTVINYQLPKDSKVSIKVYDILGSEVKTLVNEFKTAGYYNVNFNGIGLASGVYFCRIEAGDFVKTVKMMLLK